MANDKLGKAFDSVSNILGLAGGIPAIVERVGKIWGNLPEPIQQQIQQKLPGFMGLSTVDEEIFNSLLSKLNLEDRKRVTDFLYNKCQDFQRNRFTNIVASMEIVRGTPRVVERKWNENAKKFEGKIIDKKDDEDLRLIFLQEFSAYISTYGPDEAYKACIASRIILEKSVFQEATRLLGSESEEKAKQAFNEALQRRRRR
ncbi:MAG: hypothetical protein ACD_15C00078G0008 [uncultured bacterium]|nr:MAG: hypothetical protein ACD_15C00078G0008 [uncultured bacterium]